MSVINLEYNVMFIHVPKTAGRSMEEAPFVGCRGHRTALQLREFIVKNCIGVEYDDLFKFGFVRNPWDRFVSLYSHYHDGNTVSFADFVRHARIPLPSQLRSQVAYLQDGNGNLLVDFVGRFENLQDDWEHVCGVVGEQFTLPHLRKGYHRGHYKEYYTIELWDAVAALYAEDIEMWEYCDEL